MKNEMVKINGTQLINGKEITIVEGGFGENQKCILARDVALQHDVELKYINKTILNNLERFNGDDLVNLKTGSSKELVLGLGFTNAQYGNAKNIFLLSERGYIKLVAMMDNKNDKKWEVMDTLINSYFSMRKEIQTINNTVQNPELTNYVVQMGQFLATTGQTVASLMAQVGEVKELVKDSIQVKDSQIDRTMDLIGFRSVNTKRLTEHLKEKLTEYYGWTITANTEIYRKAKRYIFKEFDVIKWEDIPANRFSEVYVYIDELEMIAA